MGREEAMGEEELMEVLGLGDIFGFDRKSATINGGLEMEAELGNLFTSPSISSSPCSSSSVTLAATTAQMLCFGNISQKPSDSPSLSSLSSSPPSTIKISSARNSKKVELRGCGRKTAAGGADAGSTSKKQRTGGSGSSGGTKVRKERLGDRIVALQQLVSPFGKSDTASVLHEAQGYIRFLHDQIQILSSPYLHRLPQIQDGGGDLRSTGLCLVPVICTEQMVAGTNGADLWSPAVTLSLGAGSGRRSTAHSHSKK